MRELATEGAGANWRLDKRQRSGKQTQPARPGEDNAPAAGRLQCVSGTPHGGRSCFSCVRAQAAAIISRRWDAPHAKGHPVSHAFACWRLPIVSRLSRATPLPAILGPRALRAGVPTAPSYCCVEHFRVVHVPLVCRLLPWRSRGDYCSFACLTADTSRAVTPQLTSRHAYVMIVSRTASPPCHTITPISPVAGEISRRLLGRHAAASMASIVSRLDCAVLYAVTPPLTINYLARCTARPVCHTWSSRC